MPGSEPKPSWLAEASQSPVTDGPTATPRTTRRAAPRRRSCSAPSAATTRRTPPSSRAATLCARPAPTACPVASALSATPPSTTCSSSASDPPTTLDSHLNFSTFVRVDPAMCSPTYSLPRSHFLFHNSPLGARSIICFFLCASIKYDGKCAQQNFQIADTYPMHTNVDVSCSCPWCLSVSKTVSLWMHSIHKTMRNACTFFAKNIKIDSLSNFTADSSTQRDNGGEIDRWRTDRRVFFLMKVVPPPGGCVGQAGGQDTFSPRGIGRHYFF